MTEYIAVGAEWCKFSTRQKTAIDNLKIGTDEVTNVKMVMCQDLQQNPKPHDDDSPEKAVCDAAKDLRGYPTWFQKDSAGNITALEHNSKSLHYMTDICKRIDDATGKTNECKTNT